MGRQPLTQSATPGISPDVVTSYLPRFFLFVIFVTVLLINPRSSAALSLRGVPASIPDQIPHVPANIRSPVHDTGDLEEGVEIRPQLGEHELDQLKQRILLGLGLTKIPDISKMNVSQEEYERMYQVYLQSVEESRLRRQLEDEELEDRRNHITVQRFFSYTHTDHAKETSPRRIQKELLHSMRLYFPVDIPRDSPSQRVDVEYSTLRLFVSGLHLEEAASSHQVEVRVYQILDPEPGVENPAPSEQRLLIEQRHIQLAASASKWAEFDVTRAAESWVRGSGNNLGLHVECRECARRGVTLVTAETRGSNSSVSPVLNILANVHTGNVRDKRSAADRVFHPNMRRRTECRKDQRCCRHTMEVVFKDLKGFDFIIQPKKFDAGYCNGRCPPRYNPAHHHALLQSLIWKQNRKRAPRPCCAPNKLSELEILHVDENDPSKLKVSKWTNMSVVECACS